MNGGGGYSNLDGKLKQPVVVDLMPVRQPLAPNNRDEVAGETYGDRNLPP